MIESVAESFLARKPSKMSVSLAKTTISTQNRRGMVCVPLTSEAHFAGYADGEVEWANERTAFIPGVIVHSGQDGSVGMDGFVEVTMPSHQRALTRAVGRAVQAIRARSALAAKVLPSAEPQATIDVVPLAAVTGAQESPAEQQTWAAIPAEFPQPAAGDL